MPLVALGGAIGLTFQKGDEKLSLATFFGALPTELQTIARLTGFEPVTSSFINDEIARLHYVTDRSM